MREGDIPDLRLAKETDGGDTREDEDRESVQPVPLIHANANPISQCQVIAVSLMQMTPDWQPQTMGEAKLRAKELGELCDYLMKPVATAWSEGGLGAAVFDV